MARRARGGDRRYGSSPIATVDVDLADGLRRVVGLGPASLARVLVRRAGEPVALLDVGLRAGCLEPLDVLEAIGEHAVDDLVRLALVRALEVEPGSRPTDADGVVRLAPLDVAHAVAAPVDVTVVVCTRDRAEQLAGTLRALEAQIVVPARVLVVDDAPSDDSTRRLVAERFPWVDLVVEPRPGLDHARNRGIESSETGIVAFTDDDARPDPRWVAAIARAFAEEPELDALTGLVVAAELETPAQDLFERLGGFGRGVRRRWFHADVSSGVTVGAGRLISTGEIGTGADMAFRRSTFDWAGPFDPALDVGTPTGGGGDLDMFHRVAAGGGVLRYEPAAIVRHVHRRTIGELRRQIGANGASWSVIAAARRADRTSRGDAARVARWYLRRRWAGQLARAVAVPGHLPVTLPLAEVAGSVRALTGRPLRASRAINGPPPDSPGRRRPPPVDDLARVEVATLDLAGPIRVERTPPLTDLLDVVVTRDGAAIGTVRLETGGRPVSPRRLREELVEQLGDRVLPRAPGTAGEGARLADALVRSIVVHDEPLAPRRFDVSIVLATLDRPDDLRECLELLRAHRTRHRVELVVVDNHPASGLSAAVLDELPDVVRVDEPRRGLAAARNAGFRAASGEILVTTDDDVRVPDGWLDRLVAAFEHDEVGAVCGNVLPLELRTDAQVDFEASGGLGKGFGRMVVRRADFADPLRTFPAWDLGATANAAFRAAALDDPEVGPMDEALGPGTPSGVGEDSYLLYRIAKAGRTIVYEPSAWVRHRHRRTDDELTEQIRGYYSGHVAHNLTTFLRDGDLRGLAHLGAFAAWVARRRVRSLLRPRALSPNVTRAEVHGALRGPSNHLRARRRLRRERRAVPSAEPSPTRRAGAPPSAGESAGAPR